VKRRTRGTRTPKLKSVREATPKPVTSDLRAGNGDWERLSEKYKPFPRQEQFHRAGAKYRLFGGAAGPGKTKALLWEAIRQALVVPGSDTLLLRRTFPKLETSLLSQFRRDVPRELYRSYSEDKHVVTWNNGSTTRFGYCRNENDVYQYQGAEFLFIGIDELTHFTLKQWQFLTSRNRCPIPFYTSGLRAGERLIPGMASATNPGNIGHAWVKALWIDKVAPAGYDRPEQYDPADYDFIPAKIADNPIYANDKNYLKTLDALPDRLRRAFLEGDWSVFAGQYFDVFEIGRHTARAEQIGIQEWWPRWISIDWGFHHPSAVCWHCAVPGAPFSVFSFGEEARDSGSGKSDRLRSLGANGAPQDDSAAVMRGPRIVTYREFVKSELSPRMLGQAIAERSEGERIREVVLSPDAFAHHTSQASIAEQLGEVLEKNGLPRPAEAQDDRIGGWQLMYQLLENDEWLITENCGELIDGLPQLVRDERPVEDVRKVEGDDAADAARYGLVSGVRHAGIGAHGCAPGAGQASPDKFANGTARFVPGVPLEVRIQSQISAKDPTSRAIQSQKLQGEAK
jgi:Terminase large subunit, T4likevirus-type, N-terminal